MDNEYIWYHIQRLLDENVRFVQERNYPALIGEITGMDKEDNILVNLRTRFPYILDITKKTNEYEDSSITMHDWELDLFLHLNAHIDLFSGYNRNNSEIDQLRMDFKNELFGIEIARLFNGLCRVDQDIILRNYCSSENSVLTSFCKVFKELYPNGLIYRKQDVVFVFLDTNENNEDNDKFELLKKLFLPVEMDLKIHYKHHMGIIGIKGTMEIGKIRII